MEKVFIPTLIVMFFLLAVSCEKEDERVPGITPQELFGDSSKIAKTAVRTKDGDTETVVPFDSNVAVYRNCDLDGKSWFYGKSGGKMVFDTFMLSIYFDDIDKMRIGDELNVSRFVFAFYYSSNSEASAYEYTGKITLADKGDDYVILQFHQVGFNCSLGSYLTDGYLYCPLYDDTENMK
ncbi:MAG: hypothetical protein IJ799_06570 [Bacteroidales bacterium]|nr:hypothetical protein [Bacteroidales bacterium]